ncbi:MAG: spiro-SPASM protein [Treponema sp.]|jgi:spiro-SPASM protein|nr:spiro-SPASM protein [Treponema sp.]
MNGLLVLYASDLSKYAFEPVLNGKNSIILALEQALKFPNVGKTVLLADKNADFSFLNGIEIEQREKWTKRCLFEKISELQTGFDLIYFAFADTPFLDPALAGVIAERHLQKRAEYSYADGYPFGLTPEILSPGTAGILAKILDVDGSVEKNILFSVIEKDINSFDIEVEISPVDLSSHRLALNADSKRNFLLLNNFLDSCNGKIPAASDVERIVQNQPEILRTLPNYYSIQVYGGCLGQCKICPYPLFTDVKGRNDFLDCNKFEHLLDKIIEFSGDAVINFSLWGEIALHTQKLKLIESVIKRSELALIIETSGLGWKNEELENILSLCNELSCNAARINPLSPLSWIVSLDTADSQKYTELRGPGFAEADAFAKKLLSMFPDDCYVQAVRTDGSEEDTEKFYRYWKDAAPNGEKNIIIQKYDHFCGQLEKRQASDISPLIRQSCWHLMRDMAILIDGNVPLCREYLGALKGETELLLGNVFNDSLDAIWKNGDRYYREHCKNNYTGSIFRGLCADCDEYYTYNF